MAVQVSSVYCAGPRLRPERAASVDQLDFQQRRQMIASSLSFSDLLAGHKLQPPPAGVQHTGTKQNGEMVRSLTGGRSRTPPVEQRKHKFASLGRLFKPWKWKRKKRSDKFAETQRSLERKISVRANREELIQKGILLPDTSTSASAPPPTADVGDAPDLLKERDHLNGAVRSSPHPACRHHPAPPAPTQSFSPASAAAAAAAAAQESPPSPAAVAAAAAVGGAQQQTLGPTPPPRPERPDRPASMVRSLPQTMRDETATSSADQRFSLSRLPDPPIGVTEIGPIPPPPMFCNNGAAAGPGAAGEPAASVSVTNAVPLDLSDPRFDDLEEEEVVCGDYDDDDEEYYPMTGVGGRGEEPQPPPYQPRFDLKPLKSALKKPRAPPDPGGPSPLRSLSGQQENTGSLRLGKENMPSPGVACASGEDSDDSDGPIPYRDEPADGDSGVLTRLGSRVQRTDSLALKLALRPDRQELIDRNIIHVTSEQDRTDWRTELAVKLNRRLSLRPTVEELEHRNILKTMSQEESQRDMEAKKATLLRKLSFRPTVEELKQRKVIHFNDYVDVTQAHEYDRRADKPWTRLTPRDKAMIRKELNDFKSSEMDVHEESRHLTRFHRP